MNQRAALKAESQGRAAAELRETAFRQALDRIAASAQLARNWPFTTARRTSRAETASLTISGCFVRASHRNS